MGRGPAEVTVDVIDVPGQLCKAAGIESTAPLAVTRAHAV